MSDPFLGEVRLFGFNFAPYGWAFCDGQLMPISQNQALFSLLGTQYGGDGMTTFGLPDLRGRVAVNQGQGPGLSYYAIGEAIGTENVTLALNQMPQHSHLINANAGAGNSVSPANAIFAETAVPRTTTSYNSYTTGGSANTTMAPSTMQVAGQSLAHNNLQPLLALNYCIALQGIFPSRN